MSKIEKFITGVVITPAEITFKLAPYIPEGKERMDWDYVTDFKEALDDFRKDVPMTTPFNELGISESLTLSVEYVKCKPRNRDVFTIGDTEAMIECFGKFMPKPVIDDFRLKALQLAKSVTPRPKAGTFLE